MSVKSGRNNLPRHIAIIMDGNGRWATKRGLPRSVGHKKGVEVVEEIIKAAVKLNIEVLTLYAFSTENWLRPKKEVELLLDTLCRLLKMKLSLLMENNIKLKVMGEITRFSYSLRKTLQKAQSETEKNTGLIVNLALNYGSRNEIINAVRQIAQRVSEGLLNISDINDELFSQFLYTKDLPEPDLLIRTSGEQRLSNFMLWQLSYTELYFCPKFWPDFTQEDLKNAIEEYQKRERRFGRICVV